MTIDKLISDAVIPLHREDSCAYALSLMEESRLAHLPVIEGPFFVGMVGDQELLSAENPETEVTRYVRLEKAALTPDEHLLTCLRICALHSLTLVPVVDIENRYLGAITLPALLKAVAGLTGAGEPGGVILLQARENGFSLVDLVQLIEAEDARILSCFQVSPPGSGMVEISLKVNRVDIGPLLQAFSRLGYTVLSSWSDQDSYSDNLRERFDSLMNYLSI